MTAGWCLGINIDTGLNGSRCSKVGAQKRGCQARTRGSAAARRQMQTLQHLLGLQPGHIRTEGLPDSATPMSHRGFLSCLFVGHSGKEFEHCLLRLLLPCGAVCLCTWLLVFVGRWFAGACHDLLWRTLGVTCLGGFEHVWVTSTCPRSVVHVSCMCSCV